MQKLLQPHGIVVSSGQRDQRDLAKLADLGPTRAQIDGACNALAQAEGSVDLGRLVAKWDTYSQFAAARPAAWENKRTREADALARHVEAGGTQYNYDGDQKGMYQ